MLISGGKVIAIDSVNTSTATLSGDGVWQELGLNTSAVIDPINNKISAISGKLDNEIATRTSADNVLSAGIDYVSGVASSNSSKIDYLSDAINYVSAELDAETDTRIEDDQIISAALVQEIQNRISADSALSAAIDKEKEERIETDELLSGYCDELSANLDIESKIREEVDNILSAAIQENTEAISSLSSILENEIEERKEIDAELSAYCDELSANLENETNERIENDQLLSAALYQEIQDRTSADNVLSAAIDNEKQERISADNLLSAYCDELSANLDAETDIRAEVDDILSAAIDTKQHRLSAGDYIEIVSGEDYDTISVTGLKTFTYFATPYGRHTSTEYFTFDGKKLSANSAIGYFNLAINYKVNAENVCVDNYYSAGFNINDINVDTHYINGGIPFETYTFSKNVLNDAENNLYEIGFNKDTGIDVNDISITCVGFMGEPDPTTIGVLGANGGILTFGNNILRV